MSVEFDPDAVVENVEVRMVTLGFGQRHDFIHKDHGFREIGERKVLVSDDSDLTIFDGYEA